MEDITKMSEKKLREKFTFSELKKKVKELGIIEDPDVFTNKAQVIQILQGSAKSRKKEKEVEKPKKTDKVKKQEREKIKLNYQAKKKRMMEILEKEPKTQVFLSLTGREKKGIIVERVNKENKVVKIRQGAWHPVTINGVRTHVPKGRPVKVPQRVAEMLGQYQTETNEALGQFQIEGNPAREKALMGT